MQGLGGGGAVILGVEAGDAHDVQKSPSLRSIPPEMSVTLRSGISPSTMGIFKRSQNTYKVIAESLLCCCVAQEWKNLCNQRN